MCISIIKRCLFLIFLMLSFFAYSNETKNFIISSSAGVANIIVNEKEDVVVHTAIELFVNDIFVVGGRRLDLKADEKSKFNIRVGTIGVDAGFDKQCKNKGINVDGMRKKWEAYTIKAIADGDESTLWVVGSSPRGTAFGLMEISRMIGVSPWYWWADVRPEKKDTISLPGNFFIEDAPKVKFRGIFLNDEDWGLHPWAAKTFEPETGDIGPKTYAKVFELLLRLKANAIWPAMHPCTRAFFTYPDNIKMAKKYGIWIGSSHCEPMLRNNVDEWQRWTPSSGERGKWNFDENPGQITEYWKQRVQAVADYDAIYTVGMRGIHDGSMPGGKNIDDKLKILDKVLNTQRNLLTDITGKDVTSIPQIFCPYKEVLKLYKAGAQIPDDVTIMWADDNHGYIRQLSNDKERERSGGAGVYYHISYWGRPHDFLWVESIPVSLIWEEMYKAYQTNARNVWIVNVGDIKANEIGMNFFLKMAWNPDEFSPETLDSYYTEFAASQFGSQYAERIGKILCEYFRLGYSRKPEHMGWNSVYPNTPVQNPELSLFNNSDEVQERIDAYNCLEQEVQILYAEMPDELKDAFYQLVAYKVIGAASMNKKILYAYKSRVYARQGRVSANFYAQKADEAFNKIKEVTAFYNDSLMGGKWKNMMTYNPRNLPVFDMPPVGSFEPVQKISGGILPEGYSSPVNQDENYILPVFNSLTNRGYFVDVFNSGTGQISWSAFANQFWVKLSKKSGQTATEERVMVSVDWTNFIFNDTLKATIFFKINDKTYFVNVKAVNPYFSKSDETFFIEDNRVISMEAEHFSKKNNTSSGEWILIQSLGRAGDAMGASPVTAKPFVDNFGQAPSLYYNFYSSSTGIAGIQFYCIPTHPINDDYELRFAVSVDNGKSVVVNTKLKEAMNEKNREWKTNVLRAAAISAVRMNIPDKGKHVLKIRMIDPGVVLDKIIVDFDGQRQSYFGANETIVPKKLN